MGGQCAVYFWLIEHGFSKHLSQYEDDRRSPPRKNFIGLSEDFGLYYICNGKSMENPFQGGIRLFEDHAGYNLDNEAE